MKSLNDYFNLKDYKNKNILKKYFKIIKPWIFNLILTFSKTNIYHYHIILNILKFLKFGDMMDCDYYKIIKNNEYIHIFNLYGHIKRNKIINSLLNIKNINKIFDIVKTRGLILLNYYVLSNTLMVYNKYFFILLFANFYNCLNNSYIYKNYIKIKLLTYDNDFMYEVVKINPNAYILAKDKNFLNTIKGKLKINNKNLPLEFNDDKEFILNNTKLGFLKSIRYASKRLKSDNNLILELIRIDYRIVKYINNKKRYNI